MARSNRDVQLTLSVESLGQEGIKQLQDAVSALAKEGGNAAPEFQQLADEIGRLGQQNQALAAFRQLADSTNEMRVKQEQASQSSAKMASELDALRAATDAARARQQQATQELNDAQLAQAKATANLRQLKSEYDAAGKNTAEYRSKLQEAVRAQGEANVALVALKQNQRGANTAVTEAARAQAALEKQYARSTANADKLATSLKAEETALRQSAEAAQTLGVSTDDIAAAEGRLLTALQASVQKVNDRRQATLEMAEADRLAAIEQRGMEELYRRGAQALQAETLAQRDAVRAVQAYEEAKAKAAATQAAWQREADEIVNAAHAAQQLARETQVLTAAQKELAAQAAFEKQAQEAQRLVKAAEYVRFWETALEQAESQVQQTAQAAAQAAQRIDTAFSTLGVRSVQEIQKEIADTRVAMATLGADAARTGTQLSGAFAAGEAKIKTLEREIRELTGTLTTADKASDLLKNSLGQIAAGNLIADGVGYLVNKVKELGAAFVKTIADTESLRRGLNAVYKDVGTTAQQMLFLRRTALDAGVAVGDLGPSFLKFSAATKSANIGIQTTNELFAAVTRAAGTLGLNGEQVSGMLEALGQMASKGTVSLEELRQQLGDRLPGALSLVAQGFGISEAELIKLVESGQLAARDLFPALTQSLQKMGGEVTGLTPAWQNLKTSLTQTAQAAGDAGWARLLELGIRGLGVALGVVLVPLQAFMETLFLAGHAVVAFYGMLRGDKGSWDYLSQKAVEAGERIRGLTNTFVEVTTGAKTVAPAMQQAGAQMSSAAQVAAVLETATLATAAGLKLQAEATRLAGDASLDASQKIVKLNVEVAKELASIEAQVIAKEKLAKAAKIEGDAMVATIALRGSERDTLAAQVTATSNLLAAQQEATAARQAETDALIVQRDALVKFASTQEGGIAARKQELEAIDQKLLKSAAESAQSKAAVAQLEQELTARKLARQVYEDNSASLEKFKATAVAAIAAEAEMRRGVEAGTVTQQQYAKAQRDASVAMALYNDAIRDTTAKITALSQVEQANYNVKLAGLGVQQQAYTHLAQAAKATGDLTTATYYEVEAKKIQIQVTKLQAEAKAKEAEATIKAANAEMEALRATNSLTEVKRLEIEARIANAKAKQIEAGGSATVVKALEAEIDAIRRKGSATQASTAQTNANTSALNTNVTAIDRSTAARERAIAVQERQLALQEREAEVERRRRGVDRDGFTADSQGNRQVQFAWTRTAIIDYLKQAGLNDLLAEDLAKQFVQLDGSVPYMASAAQKRWGGKYGSLSDALGNMADYYKFGGGKAEAAQRTRFLQGEANRETAPGTMTAGTTTGARDSTTNKTVTINIGGKSQSVKVASDADANALTAILRELESAAGTSA